VTQRFKAAIGPCYYLHPEIAAWKSGASAPRKVVLQLGALAPRLAITSVTFE
jgi:hypothetical protein